MVKKDGMILEQISFQEGDRRVETPFINSNSDSFTQSYPGKNTLKAILSKVAPMGERNDFRTRISRIL